MQLKGKKVLILGDSITEGVGVSSTEKRYADVFAKMTECRVLNYGICGTRYAKKRIPSASRNMIRILFRVWKKWSRGRILWSCSAVQMILRTETRRSEILKIGTHILFMGLAMYCIAH